MLRENSQRARNTILVLWILFGLTAISIGSNLLEHDLLAKASGGNVTMDEAHSNDLRQRAIGILELLVHVVVIVYFIMWFRRAYFNLHSLGYNCRYTEGWAAGAWFVPIMNLFAPFQIMKEIWTLTQERGQRDSDEPVYKSPSILGLWWALWIIGNIAGNFYLRVMLKRDHTIEELASLSITSIILEAVDLINLFIVVSIIKQVSVFEEKLKEKLVIENIAADQSPSAPGSLPNNT